MKILKLLFLTILGSISLSSCVITHNELVDNFDNTVFLEDVVNQYDLWYVDYNKTEGTGDVPFVSRAFTLSFINGNLFANNNIAGVGATGNGLGINIGNYDTRSGFLEIDHTVDGFFSFNVVQLSSNEIRIDFDTVSYYLIGYNTSNFDYDKLFYDNIEYFLQEYIAWERVAVADGIENVFDEERFLQFTPERTTTFYSSTDPFGTNVELINWSFIGSYTVYDITGVNNSKGLVLNYNSGDTEKFELTVLDDQTIRLFHHSSETEYTFIGREFVQYFKSEKKNSIKEHTDRKRKIIKRKSVDKQYLK